MAILGAKLRVTVSYFPPLAVIFKSRPSKDLTLLKSGVAAMTSFS